MEDNFSSPPDNSMDLLAESERQTNDLLAQAAQARAAANQQQQPQQQAPQQQSQQSPQSPKSPSGPFSPDPGMGNGAQVKPTPSMTTVQAQPQMVSNPPVQPATAQQAAQAAHEEKKKQNPLASRIHDVAEVLAGGPFYRTTINDDGTRTVTKIPISGKRLGLAIALEAISGFAEGLQAGKGVSKGPGAAAVAGFNSGRAEALQRQNADAARAQQDYENRSKALAAKAQIAEVNSRTLLNTAEAEQYGAKTLQALADQNKQLIDDYEEQGVLHGRNVTQQELMEGIQSGKFNTTDMLGPIDGYRLLGNGRVEATHAVITNPTAKVTLRPEQWQAFADAHVPGFPKANIGSGVEVSGAQVAWANEVVASYHLAQLRHDEVVKALKGSDDPNVKALADKVPTIGNLLDDPKTGAGLATALKKYQSYVSHTGLTHDNDFYDALLAMAQPSRSDGKGGFVRNPDAPYADQVAMAFGGWDVLKAYHNEVLPLEIKSEAQALDMLSSNPPRSRAYRYAKNWLNAQTKQAVDKENAMIGPKAATAGAEESARVAANPQYNDPSLSTPDALGFVPNVPGGLKEYNKRLGTFKKNADDLARTEQSYQQFQNILGDINAGRDMTGAQSVVALFNAIGLSATPLKGQGFRITQNTIGEHRFAVGWEGALQQKFLNWKVGDVITPQQLRDYTKIAMQVRQATYIGLVNEAHNAGLNADFALPTGNGQKIDPATAQIFLRLSGNDPAKARSAAQAKGWVF